MADCTDVCGLFWLLILVLSTPGIGEMNGPGICRYPSTEAKPDGITFGCEDEAPLAYEVGVFRTQRWLANDILVGTPSTCVPLSQATGASAATHGYICSIVGYADDVEDYRKIFNKLAVKEMPGAFKEAVSVVGERQSVALVDEFFFTEAPSTQDVIDLFVQRGNPRGLVMASFVVGCKVSTMVYNGLGCGHCKINCEKGYDHCINAAGHLHNFLDGMRNCYRNVGKAWEKLDDSGGVCYGHNELTSTVQKFHDNNYVLGYGQRPQPGNPDTRGFQLKCRHSYEDCLSSVRRRCNNKADPGVAAPFRPGVEDLTNRFWCSDNAPDDANQKLTKPPGWTCTSSPKP